MSNTTFDHDVVVVGGCGHVGLPLAIALASRGLDVAIRDIDARAVDLVMSGELPFMENGATAVLQKALADGKLTATTDRDVIGRSEAVVVVIGTPVDEHLNPDPHAVTKALRESLDAFRDGQLVVLRSTVYPGVTKHIERLFAEAGLDLDVAFCPERIAEGRAMEELFSLPQIVSGRTRVTRDRAAKLFGVLTASIVELEPEEAELAKLFTNNWRYIKFAAANQFYVMANDNGLDYDKIRKAPGPRLSARRRHAGRRLRRRTVPVQGHHAAGGLHRQLLHPRPLGHAGERGPSALPRDPDGAGARPRQPPRRHPRHGVQG
ncbi:hypothetical protein [Nocardioides sp. B-3]|uniref:hypothetical protein n=1 Tax=Nocardioides sp. B-3 TaxID=2895565 RepID=UPI00215364E5|nr:hypothetical protein [Nocardioides sp. B-3]UUZ60469.1 hypothetical protein LP418_06185 [Nocardioides sp. B-3]